MATTDKVTVIETRKEYELAVEDIVPATGQDEPTWYNKTSGIMDTFRLIPRLIMVAYIYAFYSVYYMVHGSRSSYQCTSGIHINNSRCWGSVLWFVCW